jgi:hypothetical protein
VRRAMDLNQGYMPIQLHRDIAVSNICHDLPFSVI